jgi:hypothetical protein
MGIEKECGAGVVTDQNPEQNGKGQHIRCFRFYFEPPT